MCTTQVHYKTFRCAFYEIPNATYDADRLLNTLRPFRLNDPDVTIFGGTLDVNLSPQIRRKGSFKTAHPGKVQLGEDLDVPPFTNRKVCVKQIYEMGQNSNAIGRVRGRHELDALSVECNLLRWASSLLDLTYQFVAREIKTRQGPAPPIPALRFTRTMIAIVQDPLLEKAFLVEEWIEVDDSEYPFTKYLNNRFPQSCVGLLAPPTAHEVAEFLIFAQHVQWEKTGFSAFTSDYQGARHLLTDPQITSNP